MHGTVRRLRHELIVGGVIEPEPEQAGRQCRTCGTNWYLFFNGAKGHEQFESWLEFIRTEPACRKALQLD